MHVDIDTVVSKEKTISTGPPASLVGSELDNVNMPLSMQNCIMH